MILSISHSDLDGIGCQLCLIETFPNSEITLRNISYRDIDSMLDYLSANAYKYSKVFITDLMFKEEKHFKKLQMLALLEAKTEFYFFDHHNYDFEIKKFQLKNFIIIQTTKMSASKITLLACKKKWGLENLKLERFIECVNAYDIFDKNSIFFETGYKLFRLSTCEKYKFQKITNLIDDIIECDYHTFSEQHQEMIAKKEEENRQTLKKYKESGGIIFEKNCCVAFSTNEYIIDIIREEYEKEYDIIINMTLFGRGSVRLSDEFDCKVFPVKDTLNKICSSKKSFKEIGGHERAFGILFEKNHPDYRKDVIEIVQEFFQQLKQFRV